MLLMSVILYAVVINCTVLLSTQAKQRTSLSTSVYAFRPQLSFLAVASRIASRLAENPDPAFAVPQTAMFKDRKN